MEMQISGAHQATYDAVFQHPIAHNLQWHDVRSMLSALADVTEEHNGNLKFTRNGETLFIHPPRHKDLSDVEELMKIRHFLEHSDVKTLGIITPGLHLLVVMDHREARVYRTELHGAVPERILPYDPDGTYRHLHYVEDYGSGQRKPELKTFYEAIERTLVGAEKILIFGNATGSSSAMAHLLVELERHHPQIAQHIVGTVVVDEHHMTEGQLLAQAREFYAAQFSIPESNGS